MPDEEAAQDSQGTVRFIINSAPLTLAESRVSGVEVNYCELCQRKLWWYVRRYDQESAGGNEGAELVALGTLIHEESYPAQTRKEVLIDDLLRLDFTEDGVVHEVKKTKTMERASEIQLLYYLYYLKHVKGIVTTGELDYPLLRRTKQVALSSENERAVEEAIDGVIRIREMATPPIVEKPMTICKKCAYQDLCWG